MRKIWFIILFIFLMFKTLCYCQEAEYQMKALFLEQFTRFIEWPKSAEISDTTKPFIILVIGENPFDLILEMTYKNKKIKKKNVQIQYISTPAEIINCHILFISSSAKNMLSEILTRTKDKPIITVGDSENFAQQNVLINFYSSGKKIKFEINETAVHFSGLRVSYILFNLAKIVNPL